MSLGRKKRFTELVQSFGIRFSPEEALLIESALQEYEAAREVFVITFPQAGGTVTFPAGTTEIDFVEGTVTYGDGTKATLPNNLSTLQEQWMRSLFVETDQTINVSMDDARNFYQVIQGDYLGLIYQQFRKIYIKTTQSTVIQLWATNHPDAMMTKLKVDSARTGVVYRTLTGALPITTAQTLETTFTANYEVAGVFVHFDGAVTVTVTLTRVSAVSSNYDTVMESVDVVAGTDLYIAFAAGEGRIRSGDFIKLSIGASAGRTAYCDITTEDV